MSYVLTSSRSSEEPKLADGVLCAADERGRWKFTQAMEEKIRSVLKNNPKPLATDERG